jgi:hypothetical protein
MQWLSNQVSTDMDWYIVVTTSELSTVSLKLNSVNQQRIQIQRHTEILWEDSTEVEEFQSSETLLHNDWWSCNRLKLVHLFIIATINICTEVLCVVVSSSIDNPTVSTLWYYVFVFALCELKHIRVLSKLIFYVVIWSCLLNYNKLLMNSSMVNNYCSEIFAQF